MIAFGADEVQSSEVVPFAKRIHPFDILDWEKFLSYHFIAVLVSSAKNEER